MTTERAQASLSQIESAPYSRFVQVFHSGLTAWLILAISLLLTTAAYKISSDIVQQRAKDKFEFRSLEIEQAIKDRLQTYEQILWSGVGLFYASENVSREEWRKFVKALNIATHWPGIQGLGFSLPIVPDQLAVHTIRIQNQGFPNYSVRPEGVREAYSSIVYLEPFDWRNQRAFGYDMYSNASRREAMDRARDSAQAATSGIITLVQETEQNVQRGFLTYVPVYRDGVIPETIAERQAELIGWVYAPFRAGDLMAGILGSEDHNIQFSIYDTEHIEDSNLLYASTKNPKEMIDGFSKTVLINLQGRNWTLIFNTPADFVAAQEDRQPLLVLAAGIVIDLLLFYVIFSLHFVRRRADALAYEMTQEYRAAVERETLANQHKTDFLKHMSHELRTPLNSIIGFTEKVIKRSQGRLDEREVDALETVKRNGHNLLSLINDVLDLSQIEDGKLDAVVQEIDASALVREVVSDLLTQAKDKKLRLTANVPPQKTPLNTDSRLLAQVLRNLVSNAIKYTEEGSITVYLEQSTVNHKEIITLIVEDTGIGISASDQEGLFTEFGRTQDAIGKNIQGTGLGLVIARKLLCTLGAELNVQSQLGQGSRFTAVLPVDYFTNDETVEPKA